MKKIFVVIISIIFISALCFFFYYKNIKLINGGDVLPPPITKEHLLIQTAQNVLSALANKDYVKLAELTSPDGLTLNLYPNLDLTKIHSTKDNVSNLPNEKKVYLFGYTDGKGDPINMTTYDFINKWIYTKDYQNAPDVAVNKTLGSGNSLNSIATDIGTRDFVALHFAGFDPKYEGMDWTTIYLIFDKIGIEYKLRAIAKDNWTI